MKFLFDPASFQGVAMRADWYVFIAAACFVGIYVYACIFWCIVAYRKRDGCAPAQFSGNTPLEILYAVIPVLIVVGLFVYTFIVEMPIDHVSAAPQNRVAVTAFRWSWRFAYAGTPISVAGTPAEPPTLYLPLGRATEIDLTTADVNHSFWVPAFLFKRDAIPGMTNVFDVSPSRTGVFLSRCAQFCGLEHAWMSFNVKVVPAAAFDRYLASNGAVLP